MSDKNNEKIKKVIELADKLGWIQKIEGKPYMHLADVEKTLSVVLDEMWMAKMRLWVKDAEELGGISKSLKEMIVKSMDMWTGEEIIIEGHKFKVPKCIYCRNGMKPVKDSIAGKVTGYTWTCDCPKFPKSMIISIG